MKATKVISMTRQERKILDTAIFTLHNMSDELEKMANEDEDLKWLAEDCWRACATLDDFIETYESQFTKSDDNEAE